MTDKFYNRSEKEKNQNSNFRNNGNKYGIGKNSQQYKKNNTNFGNITTFKYTGYTCGTKVPQSKHNDSQGEKYIYSRNNNYNNFPNYGVMKQSIKKNKQSFCKINHNDNPKRQEDSGKYQDNNKINDISKLKNCTPLYSQNQKNLNFKKKSDSVKPQIIFNNKLASFKKESKYQDGVIGLVNRGNTCYLNSALQNLKNIYPLTLYLFQNYKNLNQQGFTYRYLELIANLINQKYDQYYLPKDEFLYKLRELAPNFRKGEQNDSNFCILYILNFLEKETKNSKPSNIKINKNISESEIKKFKQFINKFLTKRNSFIIDLFFGFQENIYECANCNDKHYSFQGFSVLNLSIMNPNNQRILTLEDAIKYYECKTVHNNEKGFNCLACNNNHNKITTQSVIISYPKFLIINLKRIGENLNLFYNHNVQIKMTFKVDENEYELTGFIKHIGNANSGHNIAICKNFFDKYWYIYDDSKVIRIDNSIYKNNKNEPDTTNGFMFFYKRLNEEINKETNEGLETIKNKSSEIRQF